MTNLVKLNASWNCGLNDDGISQLNLVKLNVLGNPKITNINYMTNLVKLNAAWNCGLTDEGICKLNLVKLDVYGNPKISCINIRGRHKAINLRTK